MSSESSAGHSPSAGSKRSHADRYEHIVQQLTPLVVKAEPLEPSKPKPSKPKPSIDLSREEDSESDEEDILVEGDVTNMFKLPLGCNLTSVLREQYAALAAGHLSMADLFYKHHRGTLKTYGKDAVYIANPDNNLWEEATVNKLQIQIMQYLRTICHQVGSILKQNRQICQDNGADKEDIRMWSVLIAPVTQAMIVVNSRRGGEDITRLVFEHARIASLDEFNSDRLLISFKTLVYDAEVTDPRHTFRPRAAGDMLTKALSYDPDFELIKLFASRHEEKHDIEQFFWNIFEDDDVIACVQAFFGYCFTGKTDLKIFGELVNPSNCGKTSMFTLICNALEFYASYGDVPVSEFCDHFSGALVNVLQRQPPVRLIGVDEVGAPGADSGKVLVLKDTIFNGLSDGKESQGKALSLNKKHKDGQSVGRSFAKIVVMSNGHLSIPAASSGLWSRSWSAPMENVFIKKDFDPTKSPSTWRPADIELLKRLESDAMKPAIAAWLIVGVERYMSRGEPAMRMNYKISKASLDTLCHSDPYALYLTTTFVPTGQVTDTISFDALLTEHARTHDSRILKNGARQGFKDVISLQVFADLLALSTVTNAFGVLEQVITGLRPRKADDPNWYDAANQIRNDTTGLSTFQTSPQGIFIPPKGPGLYPEVDPTCFTIRPPCGDTPTVPSVDKSKKKAKIVKKDPRARTVDSMIVLT